MKIETLDVAAIIDMFLKYTGKGYRKSKSGNYETFVRSKQQRIS